MDRELAPVVNAAAPVVQDVSARVVLGAAPAVLRVVHLHPERQRQLRRVRHEVRGRAVLQQRVAVRDEVVDVVGAGVIRSLPISWTPRALFVAIADWIVAEASLALSRFSVSIAWMATSTSATAPSRP